MKKQIKSEHDEDMELARRLQEEEEEAEGEFKCRVCLEAFMENDGVFPLRGCEHVFHKECLQLYVKSQMDMGKCPAICPDAKCGKELNEDDLKQLLNKDDLEKYHTLAFRRALEIQPDISWCPTVNCNYAFFFEDDKGTDFRCEVCKKQYCLNCRVPYHRGQTCKEYQISHKHDANDEAFIKFAKG